MNINTKPEIRTNHEEEPSSRKKQEEEDPSSSPSTILSSRSHSFELHKNPSPSAAESPENSTISDEIPQSHKLFSIENNPTNPRPENSPPLTPLHLSSKASVLENRTQRTEPETVIKVDGRNVEQRHVVDSELGGSGVKRRRTAARSFITNDHFNKKALLGFRFLGFVFCLTSFSIMAADKNQGWALDSFYRYKEFRFCVGVNIIGFVYSTLQLIDLLCYFTYGKTMIRHQFKHYFDFSMDQMIAYLLLSGSSSAATRVEDWKSNWGEDKFPAMAQASIIVSIFAFLAFASSSLFSGYFLVNLSR